MTSAVQWWNNLRLMRGTDKWIWCWADSTYWTPADCLYNRDFYKLYKKEPLAQSNARRRTKRKAETQRNRPTFLPSKPGLGQMHIRSWKYCFCETVWLKTEEEEGWSEGEREREREHAGNKAGRPEKKEWSRQNKTVTESEERQQDGRWKIAVLLVCCSRGNRRRRRETEGTFTSKKIMSLTSAVEDNRVWPLTSVKIQLPRNNFNKHIHTRASAPSGTNTVIIWHFHFSVSFLSVLHGFLCIFICPLSHPNTYIHSANTVNKVKAGRLCLFYPETHTHTESQISARVLWIRFKYCRALERLHYTITHSSHQSKSQSGATLETSVTFSLIEKVQIRPVCSDY